MALRICVNQSWGGCMATAGQGGWTGDRSPGLDVSRGYDFCLSQGQCEGLAMMTVQRMINNQLAAERQRFAICTYPPFHAALPAPSARRRAPPPRRPPASSAP